MSEALCDHPFAASYPDGMHHCRDCGATWDEPDAPTPPPTRDPIRLTDEAEAEEAWMKWADERAAPNTVYIRHRDGTPFHAGFLAGFRAARRAGGPTLADAWDEGYTNGYRLAESYLTRPDGTHVLPTNPYRTPESEDTE